MPAIVVPTLRPVETRQATTPMSRARVLFQIMLYVALAAHIAAWYAFDRHEVGAISAASVFYLIQVGLINAGALLVGAALLSTFALGNVFCGWACHFGALQDFAAWLFSKMGIVPLNIRLPVRLRAVLFVKMFVVNTIVVWLTLDALPEFLLNCGAPEPLYAVGTGITVLLDVAALAFLMTYVFGPRAFCRVLCPVILVARIGNRVAPWRMRLQGTCRDCGACDRACPMSNPVSRMLRASEAVSASDCVRCGRCRDACPTSAIVYARGPVAAPSNDSTRPAGRRRWSGALIGGCAGILFYEVLRHTNMSDLLGNDVARHLPNWEFFYAAAGMMVGAVFLRKEATHG